MKLRRLICSFALSTLYAALAHGQAVNGSLLGTVTDATGGAVPNAKVVITETNTGVSRTANTNESGNYNFADLPPGLYKVAAELTGFKRAERANVPVEVNAVARVDL